MATHTCAHLEVFSQRTSQYDWLVREKMADGALIAKWRKPGYENLCSMLAIQRNNHNFGTTSHCRVPMKQRAAQQRITPDVQTGCICCASGDGKFGGPIWWNTPMDDDAEEAAEENRAVWTQGDEERVPVAGRWWLSGNVCLMRWGYILLLTCQKCPEAHASLGCRRPNAPVLILPSPPGVPAAGQKRTAPAPADDDEDELDDVVKKRLAALREG